MLVSTELLLVAAGIVALLMIAAQFQLFYIKDILKEIRDK